jgi:predicted amidophosphoribosyltransferase
VPVSIDALKRTRRTPTQGGLSARARRRNVAGAFALRPSRAGHIEGKRVLLIDDVLTTGATLSACTRALKRAGARHVDVLVLARVVRETDITI